MFDIASFLNHLELLCEHPKAFRLRSLRCRRRLVEEFWRGYDLDARTVGLATPWLRLTGVVRLWAERLSTGGPLHRGYNRWCFNRLSGLLMDAIEKESS